MVTDSRQDDISGLGGGAWVGVEWTWRGVDGCLNLWTDTWMPSSLMDLRESDNILQSYD